jgi:hypothetical protein
MAPSPQVGQRLWARRIGWLVLIWTLSVLAVAVVAGLLRSVMHFAGLTA